MQKELFHHFIASPKDAHPSEPSHSPLTELGKGLRVPEHPQLEVGG